MTNVDRPPRDLSDDDRDAEKLDSKLARALAERDGRSAREAGERFERRGDLSEAMRAFEEAGTLGEPRAWRHLGRLLDRGGDASRAEEMYRRGAAEGDTVALRLLGQLLQRTGRSVEAEEIFKEAVRRGDRVSLRLLAQHYGRIGENERAIDLLTAATGAGDRVSRRLLGEQLIARGDVDQAIAHLEVAAEQGDLAAMRMLGELYLQIGRRSEAVVALRAAAGRNDKRARQLLETLAGSEASGHGSAETELDHDGAGEAPDRPAPPTVAPRVVSDLPSREDLLGVAPLVRGLTRLLRDPRTELPLALAITGPWGGGKSSVMLQLRDALSSASAPGGAGERRWRTVQFDAWKYERRERLWAALANAIYEQPQRDMTRRQRLRFRLQLEWRRRGRSGFLRSFLWPLPLALVGIAAWAGDAGIVGVATIAPAVAAGAANAIRFTGAVTDPFEQALKRYSRTPDYDATLGFTEQAERDVSCLLSTLTEAAGTAVAVFVDDLDRCSSKHVVEVVETMNQIFNARSEHRCLFVLGMDREVVAAAIEVAYAETIGRLEHARSPLADSFGMSLLAKLVQLSVTVPPPRTDAMRRLLTHITGTDEPASEPSERSGWTALEDTMSELAPASLEEVSDLGDELRSEGVFEAEAVEELERRLRSELIRQDSHDVVAAEAAAVDWVDRNPRQLKRFDNAFRLQLYVASEAGSLRFSPDELVALARWVAVRLRWPQLAEVLDDEPSLLAALDAHANDEATTEAAHDERYGAWFGDARLHAVLADAVPQRRVSSLPLEAFLHVA